MPSTLPLPEIADYLQAARTALRGERDQYGDRNTGAIYDHVASGPMAILCSREAQNDQAIFQDIYFSDAQGDALTDLVQKRFGIDRVLDTFGQGTALFARSSIAAGAGTLWAGTRIQITGSPPEIYEIASDTAVSGTQTWVSVPIQATATGVGTAISVTSGMTLLDPLYDPLWQPQSLTCADGTVYEPADVYRARALATRLNARNGYIPELTAVCQAAGATYVIAFPSQYGLAASDFANDFGVNAIYVADQNFQSTSAMVQACAVALEGARVLGADLWVGGVTESRLVVQGTVTLIDEPGQLELVPIQIACTQALLAYFAATSSGFVYDRASMTGAIVSAHPAVQSASFSLPSSDATLAPTNWPSTLTRYTLSARDISLAFTGPV